MSLPLERLTAALAEGASCPCAPPEPGQRLPASLRRSLRPAGVLVPIQRHEETLHVWLIRRAAHLKHHPGQIAFPGGAQEPRDKDTTAAALREAQEEIGLPAQNVSILGRLCPHETPTNFVITPVVGLVRRPFAIRPDPNEVAEVFRVPLAPVTDLTRFRRQHRHWQGQARASYAVPYGPYHIWGATAQILHRLAQRLQQCA